MAEEQASKTFSETIRENWHMTLFIISFTAAIFVWYGKHEEHDTVINQRLDRHEARIQKQEDRNNDVAEQLARLTALIERLHEDNEQIKSILLNK